MDDELNYKRWFNAGNAYFQLKEYQKALKSYQIAKKFKSSSDLLHNIELAKKMIKKRKSKEKKDSQNSNQQKENKNSSNSKNQKRKNERKKSPKDKKKRKDKKQNQNQKNKTKNKIQKAKEKLSKKEMKMWMEHLRRIKPKTAPMKMELKDIKRLDDEKPW